MSATGKALGVFNGYVVILKEPIKIFPKPIVIFHEILSKSSKKILISMPNPVGKYNPMKNNDE